MPSSASVGIGKSAVRGEFHWPACPCCLTCPPAAPHFLQVIHCHDLAGNYKLDRFLQVGRRPRRGAGSLVQGCAVALLRYASTRPLRDAMAHLPLPPSICPPPQGFRGQEWYAFAHWQYIDIFVYFGHALCVVPPPGWVAAAHRHGVRVLGTLLVEGEAGPAIVEVGKGGSGGLGGGVRRWGDRAGRRS